MIVIGLTGSFACGKSTVAGFFREKGAVIIDADKIVHRIYRPRTGCWRRIKEHFGQEILNRDRTINRKRLAETVFSHKKHLKFLCSVVHPVVIREIKNRLKAIDRKKKETLVVIDAPLLFEVGLERIVDFTICVWVERHIQMRRILKKSALTEAEVKKRLKNQMPAKEKRLRADFIIDNSDGFMKTRRQAEDVLKRIKLNYGGRTRRK